ncbi:MAG: hypothetical protein E7334_10375 [Clostridiales bacterium]|nr:hypothetical protein [Clostridiales bacterium]
MKKIDLSAKWIWLDDNKRQNDFVLFRKDFEIEDIPEKATAYIGVDTRYWMKINGRKAVTEGGLYRESMPGCGYVDEVDIARFLKKGKNRIEILAWYYGRGGRNNVDSGSAGLIFECRELGVFSDGTFVCQRHPAYYTPEHENNAYLYGGGNVGFDNNARLGRFEKATEYENVWGDTYLRPIPMFRYSKPRKYTGKLPYGMWYTVSFEAQGKAGDKIRVYSDRYETHGGPGDEMHTYKGYFNEFTLKDGLNKLSTISPVFGEKIVFSGEVSNVRYIETGYDCDIKELKKTGDKLLDKLIEKAARTLYVCMRDNFMDCPDRERGQWIGDVSVQMPQVFYLLSDSAQLLVKKAIGDFINLRKGDVLVGNVPGNHAGELPAQSLNAISEIGMIASYVEYSGDTEILKDCFEPMVRYLMLYEMNEEGLVKNRISGWPWFDHLYNIDADVLVNAWYYSALKFAKKTAKIVNVTRFDAFIGQRMDTIEKNFDRCFWKGEFYASGDFVDDRANAMAVLSGLCGKDKYEKVRKILLTVFCSTVYMENYVLMALCEMGYKEDAKRRMMSRYYNLAVNENSTLWEDLFILGTKNHAWSGAPATIAYKYLT